MKINKSLKRLQVERYTSYFTSRLISRGVPLGVVWINYGLFQDPNKTQLSGWGIVVLLVLLWRFYDDMKDLAKDLVNTYMGDFVTENKMQLYVLVFLVLLQFAKVGIGNLELVLWSIVASGFVGSFASAYHKETLRKVKELKGVTKA
jgi:hypothetical protein